MANTIITAAQEFTKDPDAKLVYRFDWQGAAKDGGPYLADGITISSYALTLGSGILTSTALTGTGLSATYVDVTLYSGTEGNDYDVACKVTLSNGEIDERTIRIKVRNR